MFQTLSLYSDNIDREMLSNFEEKAVTLSPARILNDCMTCSAVSVSAVSRVMKSRKHSNVT